MSLPETFFINVGEPLAGLGAAAASPPLPPSPPYSVTLKYAYVLMPAAFIL